MNHYETVARALTYIRAQAKGQPDLDEIATHVCMSPFHFQRVFTAWAGVSPKKFLQYLTLHHAKAALAQSATLAEAADSSGLSGTSRLHDLFLQIEGITPGHFKRQGEALQISYSLGSCQFGDYIIASTAKGICHLHFYKSEQDALADLQAQWPKAALHLRQEALHQQVHQFFQHQLKPQQKLPLHLQGTPFQLKVWEALLRIPEGQLTSYSTLAREVGNPAASRAVGTAIGSNPIAFLIPCHRVIKSVGGIGEYRWGSERKMAMIGWEAAQHREEIPEIIASQQLPLFEEST
ncbi:methylated-DNA--[protein]-cysteine S-methyltransferase [Pontibacter diazotrophicus]|uniref:methylated-DNA--[protein]-cysteine S-methyltransferase n=1 Tax=Pontibacter diazotrophicus TaxID=1400979 RepID=A0A3D8L9E3_9BACT|nr:methylated-DNA--[protein]-cysteine S-methyltransferase [Pontibacter diazotrophicus]RDV13974.1 methylated-DNA--[protein]-cysteine S-methyltransferase [Pontibacter diazotrophicus]